MSEENEDVKYDTVLENMGNCGKFQISRVLLIVFILFNVTISQYNFLFYSLIPSYRCAVPNCEDISSSNYTEYQPKWLKYAVPYKNNLPIKCDMYEYIGSDNLTEYTTGGENLTESCSIDSFNTTNIIRCDDYIFDGPNFIGIAKEFGIYCEDKLWMLTLPASIQFVGQFLDPLSGYLSDRFGRKRVFLALSFSTGVICQLQAYFAYNYWILIFFELLQSIIRTGVMPVAFTLSLELISTKHRSLGAFFVFMTGVSGEAILGIIAMYASNWRTMIQISSFPPLLILFYGWIIPESIRWLLAKNKIKKANIAISKIAKVNGVKWNLDNCVKFESKTDSKRCNERFVDLFKSARMVQRIAACMACWIIVLFVFYGLILGSVTIFGNVHFNFILVSLIEIPGNLAALVFANLIGRKKTLCLSYLIAATACFSFAILKGESWLKMSIYLLGKCAISTAFDCIYIYTAELFPTPFRQRILSICSAFGRVGAILATQMPFLANMWISLPYIIFGGASIIAGIVTLAFPETLNTKLPDTISESLNIGSKKNITKENVSINHG